jgi:hypothetical protein
MLSASSTASVFEELPAHTVDANISFILSRLPQAESTMGFVSAGILRFDVLNLSKVIQAS